jgi:hypothetical protein
MTSAQQSSTALAAHSSRSAGIFPSALFPFSRYFYTSWLNESSGFCPEISGHVSQQVPQMEQFSRLSFIFMVIFLFLLYLS